jgi:methionyl-tRNA formyltransferase
MNQSNLRFAFAGDRDIAVWILDFLLEQGFQPEALFLSDPQRASHAGKLKEMCSFLPSDRVLTGADFRSKHGMQLLASLRLDYLIGVHFPYLVPESVLAIPKIGVLNLHPAYLPYNRGWHTPSWAILEGTPVGATLHFMDSGVDTGDIVHQKEVVISPGDTADTLYQKLKCCERDMFVEAWPGIVAGTYKRRSQNGLDGTQHKRSELLRREVQEIDLNATMAVGDLLRRLRGLTTNKISEAAYFTDGDKCYRVQVIITENGNG